MTKSSKILAIFLSVLMVLCIGTYSFTYADESISQKQDKLNNIKDKQEDLESSLQKLEASLKKQQAALDKQQAKIVEKKAQIAKTQSDLEKKEKEIAERKDGLDKRLRTMYKNGSIGYLDVLLGSNSISEFISNVEMVQKVYKSDQDTLNELKTQEKELSAKKAKLKKEKAELDAESAVLAKKKAKLKESQAKVQAQYDKLDKEADQIKSEINKLVAEANAKASASGGKVNTKYTGGKFIWPTTSSIITSGWGYRTGVGSSFHQGLDIGAGYGSPVYAAASGTVILSSYFGGYGNCVSINHGGGISTLYGHNSRLIVSVGTHVKQGQLIAYSGNSGVSSGPHLHFSVIVNGSFVNPMNYFR